MIDAGSSLNLISTRACQFMDLDRVATDSLNIKLPNGDSLNSEWRCPQLNWRWDKVEFSDEFWVVELQNWDVILGVTWLSKLGDVNCNFGNQTLSFCWQDQKMTISQDSQLELEGNCHQLTSVIPMWMEEISRSYEGDQEIQDLMTEALVTKAGPQQYYVVQGMLQFKGKWVIGQAGGLRKLVFEELHGNSIGGHSGNGATYKRIAEYFYWSTIRQDDKMWAIG